MSKNPWIVFMRHGYPATPTLRKKPADMQGPWVRYLSQMGYRVNNSNYGCLNGKTKRANVRQMTTARKRNWLPTCFANQKGALPHRMRPKAPRAKKAPTAPLNAVGARRREKEKKERRAKAAKRK